MPIYQYQVVDEAGRSRSGMMEARDEATLEQSLMSSGLWLLDASVQKAQARPKNGNGGGWGGVKRRDLIDFCTLMSFQSRVGVPLIQGLDVAAQECDNPRFREVILGLKQHIEAGLLLNEALQRFPKIFPAQFVNVVRAGEMSSQLPETFDDLRSYLEWVDQIVADVRQASTYPAIVVVVVAAFVLLLFSFVIPKFMELLTVADVPLPLLTTIVFGVSEFAKATWWLWAGLLVIFCLSVVVGKRVSPAFAMFLDRCKLKVPVFGELNLMLSISRLTHNLSVLYRSGIPILTAFQLSESLVGNAVVAKAVRESRELISAGQPISESMRRQEVFPSMLLRMVLMGEKTGTLDTALDTVSDYYNLIIPRRLKKIFALVEPGLIIFLIFVVGTVALAVFLPILSLMSALR